jgi:uncharacterized membrane protein
MLWVVALGIATGMRTMTPIAALCWFAWLGLLPETGWARFFGSLIAAILFTAFAIGEYIGDTLPKTPSRTAAGPLISRLVFGSLVGILVAKAMSQPVAGGVVFGVVGVLIGAYGGVRVRLYLSRKFKRDLPVALCESVLAVAIAVTSLAVLHIDIAAEAAALSRTFT